MTGARILSRFCTPLLFALGATFAAAATNPSWVKVSSAHFSVLTDAGQKKGQGEVAALRFEQMRSAFGQLLARTRLNMPEPLEIIALKSDGDYVRIAPPRNGAATGFFLSGEDRNYIVLNLSDDQSWRAVAHDFAHLMLNYNYPPTPAWFDEGFAEYFASIRMAGQQAQFGGDPESTGSSSENTIGTTTPDRNAPKSLVELLSVPVWLSIPDLFSMAHTESLPEGSHHTLFYAESWIVMHYLLNENKLAETGTYFGLVQNQKVPVEQAIQQAYGMSPAQLEQAIKDYFHALAPSFGQDQGARSQTQSAWHAVAVSGDTGTTTQDISEQDGKALVAEMATRIPERREQAVKDLQSIVPEPKHESAIPHRALAWVLMQKKDYEGATEELGKALEIDQKDLWVRYYLALVKYHAAQSSGGELQGLGNMMQDLRAVLDIYPDFAQAYYLLALARVEGGGINSALESIKAAIHLNPRSEIYLLELAQIYMAGKHWDAASELLEHLAGSQNKEIAHAASNGLADLPTLKKYGRLPQAESSSAPTSPAPALRVPTKDEAGAADDDEHPQPASAEPQPDKRSVQFAKGKLISVDCAQAPAAVLTIATSKKTVKLRTDDYKSLVLMGADEFSCSWRDRSVAVNYKAGGKADGDLVSLEVQ
jgi:tetratricopeptide (TPR) repeat protein